MMSMLYLGYHFGFYRFECVLIYDAFILTCIGRALMLSVHLRSVLSSPHRDMCRTEGCGKTATRQTLSQWTARL